MSDPLSIRELQAVHHRQRAALHEEEDFMIGVILFVTERVLANSARNFLEIVQELVFQLTPVWTEGWVMKCEEFPSPRNKTVQLTSQRNWWWATVSMEITAKVASPSLTSEPRMSAVFMTAALTITPTVRDLDAEGLTNKSNYYQSDAGELIAFMDALLLLHHMATESDDKEEIENE